MPIDAPISLDAKRLLEAVKKRVPAPLAFSGPLPEGDEEEPEGILKGTDSALWRYRWNPVARYAAAPLLVAAACGLTFAARAAMPALTMQSALFVFATVASSWFGGFRPGVLASFLSAVCIGAFFLQPGRDPLAPEEFLRLSLNFLSGVGISWLGGVQRRHEAALVRNLARLDETVQARTADIRSINAKLAAEVGQRIRAQEALLRFNRALRVRSVCNRLMIRVLQEELLLDKICYGIVRGGEYRLAGFHAVSSGVDGQWRLSPDGLQHVSRAFESREPEWREDEFEYSLIREAIRVRRPQICLNLPEKTPETPWRQWAGEHALRSLAVLPLNTAGGMIGVLLIYSDDPEDFDRREAALLQMVANDVARGVALLRVKQARKKAEETLKAKEAELTRVSRATVVGELTASIGHEINQPLTAVITGASACRRWLGATPPNLDEAREALQRITRDGNRAAEIIQRIRGLFVKGRSVEERAARSVNDVVNEILTLTRGELKRRGAELECDLTPDLPLAEMDQVQIQQILMNLVSNALDAMEAITDREHVLKIRTGLQGPETILVSVTDTGCGLAPEQYERLFDAFYTTKAQGLGMGLSISRSIIESHGGRLWAEPNNEGPGTIFQFTLPVVADIKEGPA